MEEVIELEKKIRRALIERRVPNNLVGAAEDILHFGWKGSGTRLEKLRDIASKIGD